jgi:regulatory protein
MKKVTAVRAGRNRKKRVNIFLDDRFAFSLEAEVAIKEGLRPGLKLGDNDIQALTDSDNFQRCLNAAIRFLSYRPRSQSELRKRLTKHGFDSERVAAVISRLKEQGMADDSAFARFWVENREAFSPRGQRMLRLELRQKGVPSDILEAAVSGSGGEESAYRAAIAKARSLSRADYPSFRRKLGEYLKRRGFDYSTINNTVARVWKDGEEVTQTKGGVK